MSRVINGRCPVCHGYHTTNSKPCGPLSGAQPWHVGGTAPRQWSDPRRQPGRCDGCGDPTTAFTADGATRCYACQKRGVA